MMDWSLRENAFQYRCCCHVFGRQCHNRNDCTAYMLACVNSNARFSVDQRFSVSILSTVKVFRGFFFGAWEKENTEHNSNSSFVSLLVIYLPGDTKSWFSQRVSKSSVTLCFLLFLFSPRRHLADRSGQKSPHADTKSFVRSKAVIPVCTRSTLQTLTTCQWHARNCPRGGTPAFGTRRGTSAWSVNAGL